MRPGAPWTTRPTLDAVGRRRRARRISGLDADLALALLDAWLTAADLPLQDDWREHARAET